MYFVGDYLDEFYDCDALLFDYFYEINYFLCDSKLHGREVVLIGPIVDVATLTGGWKGCDIHSLLAISPHPTLLFCRLNGRREEVTYRSPSHCLVCMCVCVFFCVLFFSPATSPVFVTFSSWSMDASCRLLYFLKKKEGDFHLTHSSMRTSKAIAEWELRSIFVYVEIFPQLYSFQSSINARTRQTLAKTLQQHHRCWLLTVGNSLLQFCCSSGQPVSSFFTR